MPQREEPYLNGEENQGCLLEAICTPGNATPLDSSSSQSPMVRVPEMHSGGQSPSCFLGDLHTLFHRFPIQLFVALSANTPPSTVSTPCLTGAGEPLSPAATCKVGAQKRTHATLRSFWFVQRASSVMTNNIITRTLTTSPCRNPAPFVVSLELHNTKAKSSTPALNNIQEARPGHCLG